MHLTERGSPLEKFSFFDPVDMRAFEPTAKVGLLATVNPGGLPHITLITTLQAKSPTKMLFGQFTEGLSKHYIRENPKCAFLIMTMDRRLWRGKALYTHCAKEGEDYEMLNDKPMFRYNSYFGINTVYYMDLVETYGKESLPLGRIIPAALATRIVKPAARTGSSERILNPWSEKLFNAPVSPKFLSYVGPDGFPVLIPIVQGLAADSRRIVFSPMAYEAELRMVPSGATAAVFCMSMQMEDILVRGAFRGFRRHLLVELGVIDIDWVYNSMPPNHGLIYPARKLEPVRNFQ